MVMLPHGAIDSIELPFNRLQIYSSVKIETIAYHSSNFEVPGYRNVFLVLQTASKNEFAEKVPDF